MIVSLIKYSIFGALMLLVGQIPIGSDTLGGKFSHAVGDAGRWSAQRVSGTKMLAGVGDLSLVERWWKSATPGARDRKPAAARVPQSESRATIESDKDADGVSQADREALIRLLQ